MSNEIATQTYDREKIELLKKTICYGATDNELSLFLTICRKTGLDPFSRQIYMIERRFKDRDGSWKSKRETIASIDGFRVIAERSGDYAGQLGPFWCGEDGVWKDVWLTKTPPLASKVGILKNTFKEPLWAVAKWDSYAQMKDGQPTSVWGKMPEVMLAKCAEAMGLRRAFPNNLSGIYTNDEMAQMENVQESPITNANINPNNVITNTSSVAQIEANKEIQHAAPSVTAAEIHLPPTQYVKTSYSITEKQANRLYAIAKSNKWSVQLVQAYVSQTFNKNVASMNRKEYDETCEFFNKNLHTDILEKQILGWTPEGDESALDMLKKAQKQPIQNYAEGIK